MLEAHCRATLRPTADGDYELCCAPEVEMATYEAVDNFTTFAALPAFPCPVHYVAAEPAEPPAPPTWAALVPGLAAARTHGELLSGMTAPGQLMPYEKQAAGHTITLKTHINFSEYNDNNYGCK